VTINSAVDKCLASPQRQTTAARDCYYLVKRLFEQKPFRAASNFDPIPQIGACRSDDQSDQGYAEDAEAIVHVSDKQHWQRSLASNRCIVYLFIYSAGYTEMTSVCLADPSEDETLLRLQHAELRGG
jgi:hypothetical protein